MDIRELTTDEEFMRARPVLAQLREPAEDEAWYRERLATMREEGYRLFAAFDGDEIVAVAGVGVLTNFYYHRHVFVFDLVTAEDRRSEGFGGALLEHVEAWAREQDCETVALESGLWREDAHRFYEDRGYEALSYAYYKELDGE